MKRHAIIVVKTNISSLEHKATGKWASFSADLDFVTQTHSKPCSNFQNSYLFLKYRQYFCFRCYIIVKHFLQVQPKSIMPMPWRESRNEINITDHKLLFITRQVNDCLWKWTCLHGEELKECLLLQSKPLKKKPLEVERQILVLLLLFDSTLLNQSPFLKQLVIYCPKYVAVVICEFRVTQLLNLTNYG